MVQGTLEEAAAGLPAQVNDGEVVAEILPASGAGVSYPSLGRKKQRLPELVVLTALVMSGRLDSNQRPPEPH
jgi:hypothetical protein